MPERQTKEPSNLAIQVVAMPADTNANGDIFGGWLVSHMDLAAGIEAKRRAKCRVVTVAIDALTFIKPVKIGDVVSCYAQLLKIGRTSMQFKIEAWSLSINETEAKKVAEGIFTFVAIDEQGKPRPVVV
ncbi:MAG TPA: acyl-CoA thioesterase [Gammaproteobacteria bacterium]|jgi:acyl-CoA thioesterase YciA|nr:acyl-CoA thioesterase [Gammaproteobacteria bacterium]